MIVGIVVGRAIFSDSDFHRLLEKLTFKYDGLVVLTKMSMVNANRFINMGAIPWS